MQFQHVTLRGLGWGAQACVFSGAAQVSQDVDFLILADATHFRNPGPYQTRRILSDEGVA